MRSKFVLMILMVLISGIAFAEGTHPVVGVLTKDAEVVATVTLQKEPETVGKAQDGMISCRLSVKIEEILLGKSNGNEMKKDGVVELTVSIPEELTKGETGLTGQSKHIMFLKQTHWKKPYWTTVDNRFAIQPFSVSLANLIRKTAEAK